MRNLVEAYFPSSLKEFSEVYRIGDYIVAGSVYSFRAWQKRFDMTRVVFVNDLPLRYIKKSNSKLIIGSLNTFDDLEHNKDVKTLFGGYISNSVSKCSSQLIRNMATIGGNIAHPSAFNIIPVVLETLNGIIVVFDGKKTRNYTLPEFYSQKPIGLITEIKIPLEHNKDFFIFEKISKTESSWESYITISFRLKVEKGLITDASFVVGGISQLPFYEHKLIASLLFNNRVKDINCDKISDILAKRIYFLNPSHHYAEFRKDIVRNIVFDFLSSVKKEV
ncbi:MAG: FAD binding domain-containing protein [Elusimicrobiales bacterium]|nr:FAD binding domain-containing protein [Elusimicrobiales bacterium]